MNGVFTLASCPQGDPQSGGDSLSPWEVDWQQPIALLIGNEGTGLPEEIIRSADARVHIPMGTRVESLNAAAAAAVLFYEAFRQRFPRPGG
jgi:RNA methyltransferase, TrmH family